MSDDDITLRSLEEHPNRVPMEERPDATVDNIPDEVLESAIKNGVSYGECPECQTQQFHPTVPGHNTSWECLDCGFVMHIIG